jgi:hypothetical protein
MQSDNLIYFRHRQYLLDVAVGACCSQFASRLFHLARGHHDDPNSGAVDVRHSGQIKDDFFAPLAHKLVDGPFQLLAIHTERDPSRYFEDDNVGLQLLGLNFEHTLRSFPDCFDQAVVRGSSVDQAVKVNNQARS